MQTQLSFEIVTLEGLKFQEDVWQVELPTPTGLMGILPNHIPLIGIVSRGVVSIRRHEEESDEAVESLATAGGFVEIDGKRVRLLADSAELAEDIDEMKAKEALVRAQELQRSARDVVSLSDATTIIQRETARLKVAEIKRRRMRRM